MGEAGLVFCPRFHLYLFLVLVGCGLAADGRRWLHARVWDVDGDADVLCSVRRTDYGVPSVRLEASIKNGNRLNQEVALRAMDKLSNWTSLWFDIWKLAIVGEIVSLSRTCWEYPDDYPLLCYPIRCGIHELGGERQEQTMSCEDSM
ncbi:hypothetical protein VTN00DRAFT_2225 [Thermoascus crustaceus]|uniref:uncharacterized protein n=1 Tax=Thermoascus crustaceus TaxID=5088 RepID=UPI0037423E06